MNILLVRIQQIKRFKFRPDTEPIGSGFESYPIDSTHHSAKENKILHLLIFFFYSNDDFFIRKILIFSKLHSSARTKISLFFSYLCGSHKNSRSEFVTVGKRIQFCISSFPSSTLRTNFSKEKFLFCETWLRPHEPNFPYFSFSATVQTQIVDRNLWQFERKFNSASPRFLLLLSARIFHKKNFNYVKAEFDCTNEIFLIFQLLVQLRPKFSISISDSLKENSILHLLISLIFFDDEFFTRESFIFIKLNSSARMKFSLFFSYRRSWDQNSRSQFVTVWKRIQFCICSFSSSTLNTKFSHKKF